MAVEKEVGITAMMNHAEAVVVEMLGSVVAMVVVKLAERESLLMLNQEALVQHKQQDTLLVKVNLVQELVIAMAFQVAEEVIMEALQMKEVLLTIILVEAVLVILVAFPMVPQLTVYKLEMEER